MVGNGNDTKLRGAKYEWDFGDGSHGQTEGLGIAEHDYTDALIRDELTTQFNVSVAAQLPDGSNQTAERTVSVHNLYAHNKRHGMLTPRAHVRYLNSSSPTRATVYFWSVKVTNLEDETIQIGEQRLQLLDSTPGSFDPIQPPTSINLTIGPHETAELIVALRERIFKKNVFGFGVHLNGSGCESKLPVITSVYHKVRTPYNLLRGVNQSPLIKALDTMFKGASIGSKISHRDIQHILEAATVPVSKVQPVTANISRDTMPETNPGFRATLSNSMHAPLEALDQSVIMHLIDGGLRRSSTWRSRDSSTSTDDEGDELTGVETMPKVGQECDPDNVPDDLADGFACQYTGTSQWKFAPGMLLNAHKGDLILSPGGGPGPVGQLLQHVNPAQFYSHQGIMTQNFIEVRHSTASEDWLVDHPAGFKGSAGFTGDALRYGWPGTITQSIDHSFYGEPMTAENGRSYLVSALSYYPNRGDHNTLISPLVIKPTPQFETAGLRRRLHGIAKVAQDINGHYRFYAYTRPEMALEPSGTAPAEAGWAAGTVATVCSSFVWLACKMSGVQLESPNRFTSPDDLESGDIRDGAQAGSDTLDGLYLYTAQERQEVAAWLHGYIEDKVSAQTPWYAGALNAPFHIANLFVNTFAFDWVDGSSMYFDIGFAAGDANAVSPDNTLWWDSPANDNRNGFQSVYGHPEDLFYSPGDFTMVKIYKWAFSPSKGSVCGTVTATDGPVQGCAVSMTGQPDVIVAADGRFCFTTPVGTYTVSAGLNIRGSWYTATKPVDIAADETKTIVLDLLPPPEIHRQVTVTVQMDVTSVGISACGTCTEHKDLLPQSVALAPFHEDASLIFEGDYSEPYVNGRLLISLHLNADLSVSVSYTAELRDGAEVDNSLSGVGNVPKDWTMQWTKLTLSHTWWSGAEGVVMDWTIENALGHA